MKMLVFLLGIGSLFSLDAAAQVEPIPHYKIDPSWPKEFPNNWILGNLHGIAVDKHDHVWVLSAPRGIAIDQVDAEQNPPRAMCCIAAPSVIELDTNGNVLTSWGRPDYLSDWPVVEQGIFVDKGDAVWIGGLWAARFPLIPGRPIDKSLPLDHQLLKLTNDGRQLMVIGHPSTDGANDQDVANLGGPGATAVDDVAHEVYIADGYINKRIVVHDSETGAFKRGWGAYGIPLNEIHAPEPAYNPADPPSKQFRGTVTGIAISNDGFIYVCDRSADRIQVFTKEGKFVKEFFVRKETLGIGSTWSIAFSHGPKQKYLLVADGEDGVIWILNRDNGAIVGQFGHKGHNAGQFDSVLDIATDSHGNLYTAEINPNARVQKFILTK